MNNDPATDALKLSRLPKWAQEEIANLRGVEKHLKATVADLEGRQEKRKPWHDHEISTSEYNGVTHTTRYFVASDVNFKLDNGLIANLSPQGNHIRVIVNIEHKQGEHDRPCDVVILPRAGNSFNICLAEIK